MALDNKQTDNFLSLSSYIGLLALFYCKKMYDQKKAFQKAKFSQIYAGEYCFSYIVACRAFGFLVYTRNEDIFNITQFDDYLGSQLEKFIISLAEKKDRENSNSKWMDDFLAVKEL